jgi:hypothetical protein
MRRLVLLVVAFTSLTVSAQTRRAVVKPSGAVEAVQSFFRFHLAHKKGFTRENIVRRRRWLTPELYRLLLGEYHREELESARHPDEVVFMEGDPFTDSQEHPDSFRVGAAVMRGSRATIPVTFYLKRAVLKKARVEVARRGRVWLIHNMLPDDDEDLLKMLRGRVKNSSAK